MAMLLKDRYNLKTLRCWIGYRESARVSEKPGFSAERVLRTQLYQGRETVGVAIDTPLGLLDLDPRGYPPAKTWIHDLAGTPIEEQLRTAAEGNPAAVWLHIKQDSYPLALLPWEEMAGRIVDAPILRISNFVEDPYRPVAAPVIAICASQPVGDGPYQLVDFVSALLASIGRAARFPGIAPRVSIFADASWTPAIRDAVGRANLGPTVVEVVEPTVPPIRPDAGRKGGEWLGWMADHFAGRTVDIVHFVTPGWFAENHGAIALAETPTSNVGGGVFLGAADLAYFYDGLGCSGMAFSSPHMPEWEWGQRMLAFELSWLRPGPVMVFEHGTQDYRALADAYGLLFGGGWQAIDPLGYVAFPPQLTCHPRMLEGRREPGEALVKTRGPEPGDLLSRHVDQAMAQLRPNRDLSMTEQWEAAGAANALAFVKSLY